MEIQQLFVSLRPVFDSMAHILLEPETLGASASIPVAADVVVSCDREMPEQLRTRLQAIAAKSPVDDLALSQSYAKLFLGVGKQTIPLCESAWTSAQHLLCQGAQLECKTSYEKAGLELAGDSVVPEDHLGLMFGFLAVMALREDAATGLEFYKAHIAPLTPTITQAVRERENDAGAYLDVADVLDGIAAILS